MKKSGLRAQSSNLNLPRLIALLAISFCTLFFKDVQAQTEHPLPWYEGFAYTEGVLAPNTPNDSSVNWNMHGSGDEGSPIVSVLGGLTYSGLAFTNRTTGVAIGTTTSNRNRGARIQTASSGTLYTSFLLNVQSAPSGNRIIAALSSVTGGETASSPGGSSHCVWVNSARQLLITKRSTADGTPKTGPTAPLSPGTHLVVLGYTFNAGSANDKLELWLDPTNSTFGGTPPASLFSTNTGSDTDTLASFWIMQRSSDPQMSFAFDELRIATSWAEVVPAGPTPEASTLVFTNSPNFAGVGQTLDTVNVQVYDQYGYPFASGGVPVALSINSGSLSGTLTQNTDSSGKAVFAGLSINSTGHKQLSANASGLVSSESGYFTILPGGGGGGPSPKINQTLKTGNDVVLRGNNGSANQPFNVLANTSLTSPVSSWSSIGAGNFKPDGTFDVTNAVSPGDNAQFFALSYTGGGGGGQQSFPMMGWVNSNNVSGGAGGPVVIVSNYNTLAALCQYGGPVTIYVKGSVTNFNQEPYVRIAYPNKSILGYGPDSVLHGANLRVNATNVIIRNLYITETPWGVLRTNDCITIDGGGDGVGGYVWVDHCTFYNGQDGSIDIAKAADYVTVSWCKFSYGITDNPHPEHRLVNLIGSSDNETESNGKLKVTFHHNWYYTNCMERMPSVRFGRVHCFNNYYKPETTNLYCIRTRINAEVLAENNYFDSVQNPWERLVTSGTPGKLRLSGNITNNCTFNTSYDPNVLGATIQIPAGDDDLIDFDPNSPPYWYSLDPAANVPSLVTTYSGQAGGIFPVK